MAGKVDQELATVIQRKFGRYTIEQLSMLYYPAFGRRIDPDLIALTTETGCGA